MDASKLAAAKEALKFVKPGMNIGLGTGSTTAIFIDLLGKKNRQDRLGLTCIATSVASKKQAESLGLEISGFDRLDTLDVAFDGADQVDSGLNMIKGLGGALVREKIVDYRAGELVIMVGENKLVGRLTGTVPVEVIPLSEWAVKRDLIKLGAKKFETRMDGRRKFISDNSNLIVHAEFPEIDEPRWLEDAINRLAGVVDNGIFTGKRPRVIVGDSKGRTRALR